jgi:hypothetical protein
MEGMQKIIQGVILLLVLFLIGFGIYSYQQGANSPLPNPMVSNTVYSWMFTELGKDKTTGIPMTKMGLKTGGKTYELGTYQGSCTEITQSAWKLLPNERTGVICLHAGSGKEIGVFEENGVRSIRVGDLDEDNAETSSTRGDFKVLQDL